MILELIACSISDKRAAVLNVFRDVDYNRSVLTIASTATHLGNVKYA